MKYKLHYLTLSILVSDLRIHGGPDGLEDKLEAASHGSMWWPLARYYNVVLDSAEVTHLRQRIKWMLSQTHYPADQKQLLTRTLQVMKGG